MSAENAMTVAVTGATGFVGRHVVRTLVDRGYHVRALIRSRDKAASILPAENVTLIEGDILVPDSLDDLMTGVRAAVHTVGIIREAEPGASFRKIHIRGVRNVVEAAGSQGVSRFLHVSALGVRPNAASDYHRSKYEGERLVRGSGLDWTIFRPSMIHGPEGEFVMMVRDMALGRMAPYVFIPYFARVETSTEFPPKPPKLTSAKVQPVCVEDVAAAIVTSIGRQETVGEVYPLGGPDVMDWPTMLAAIRDATPLAEKKRKVRPIPAPLGVAAAKAAGPLGLAAALPFGSSEPIMSTEDSTCSNDKASRHFDFDPQSFESSLASYADQL